MKPIITGSRISTLNRKKIDWKSDFTKQILKTSLFFVFLFVFPLASYAGYDCPGVDGYLHPGNNAYTICSEKQIVDPNKVIDILNGVKMDGIAKIVTMEGKTTEVNSPCSIEMNFDQELSRLLISWNINLDDKQLEFKEFIDPGTDLLFVKRDTEDFGLEIEQKPISIQALPGKGGIGLIPVGYTFFLHFTKGRSTILSYTDSSTATGLRVAICQFDPEQFTPPKREEYSY